MRQERRQVVLIAIDAADSSIIGHLTAAGRMPNLARLWRGGKTGLLEPRLFHFEAMTWHRFNEGRNVSPRYFQKVWNQEAMGSILARGGDFEPRNPFWLDIARAGARVALVDVPLLRSNIQGAAALFVKGWQAANDQGRSAEPGGLLKDLTARFGPPLLAREPYGRQRKSELLEYRERAIRATLQAGEINAWLIGKDAWDLYFFAFGTTHNTAHYFWDTSQVAGERLTASEEALFRSAVHDVYMAADQALGNILEAAASDARILVFSPYGMAANTGWIQHLSAMLDLIHGKGESPRKSTTGFGRLRTALLGQTLVGLFRSLPLAVQMRLVTTLSPHFRNWPMTRYVQVAGEPYGFIRINLRGRERQGVVEPGAEYRALVEKLREDLMSFQDLDTGLRVVKEVHFMDDFVTASEPERCWLPDLVVIWTDELSAQDSRGVRSDLHGELALEKGVPFRSGRSGEHRTRGWFVASGPGIEPGTIDRACDTIDLPPTVCQWLGVPKPSRFEGAPIRELTNSAEWP